MTIYALLYMWMVYTVYITSNNKYMPTNKKTGQVYTRQNSAILEQIKAQKGYLSNEWLTFLQGKELGLSVKKGEKGTRLVRVFDTDNSDTAGKAKKAVKSFVVFNIEQFINNE